MDELLIEIAPAAAPSSSAIAQLGGGDHLVELGGPRLIVELRRGGPRRGGWGGPAACPPRHRRPVPLPCHRTRIVAPISSPSPSSLVGLRTLLAARLDCRPSPSPRCLARHLPRPLLPAAPGPTPRRRRRSRRLSSGTLLALHEFELFEQPHRQALECPLVVERQRQRVEIGTILDPVAHQREPGRRGERRARRGRSAARAPTAPSAVDSGTSSLWSGRGRNRIGPQPCVERLSPDYRRSLHSRGTPSASTRAPTPPRRTPRAPPPRPVRRRAWSVGIVVLEAKRETIGEAASLGHLIRSAARVRASAP